MINDLHTHDVFISGRQMRELVINQKDINIISKQGAKITISKPIKYNYKVDSKTKRSSYVVSSKITLETGTYLGTLAVKSEDGKTYTGTLTYQKE